MRRLAFNHVRHDKFHHAPGVIEVEGDIVVRTYPLVMETEQTEWIGGTACLKEQDNRLRAFKQAVLITEERAKKI